MKHWGSDGGSGAGLDHTGHFVMLVVGIGAGAGLDRIGFVAEMRGLGIEANLMETHWTGMRLGTQGLPNIRKYQKGHLCQANRPKEQLFFPT